jgi:hypothetical protein
MDKHQRHNVKRVVITSSVAAILEPKDTTPYTFTEASYISSVLYSLNSNPMYQADWNNYSPNLVEKEGKNAPAGQKYRASKTLAERSAWEFVEKHREVIKFDLTTINPVLVSLVDLERISMFRSLILKTLPKVFGVRVRCIFRASGFLTQYAFDRITLS